VVKFWLGTLLKLRDVYTPQWWLSRQKACYKAIQRLEVQGNRPFDLILNPPIVPSDIEPLLRVIAASSLLLGQFFDSRAKGKESQQ
jgi:hypothetical protein